MIYCLCAVITITIYYMALSDLLSVGCDVELKLDDCTMPASSVVLRLTSGVFSNALDADCHTPSKQVFGRSTSPSAGKTTNIPLPGVSKEQWLRIAEFLYPVVPSPKIKDWAEAEYLLEVGGLSSWVPNTVTVPVAGACTTQHCQGVSRIANPAYGYNSISCTWCARQSCAS